MSSESTTEEKALAFWSYLIDHLTPIELKEVILICLGSKKYKAKEIKK